MHKQTIASLHRYSNRFLRSADLVRDFHDPKGMEGYWLTDFGRSCLKRISDGFRPDSSRRAWRLTGDFGSGKSSFALLMANTARDVNRLPKGLRDSVLRCVPDAKKQHYMPVLVMGKREPMALAVVRSLQNVLTELYSRGAKSALDQSIEKSLRSGKLSDQTALSFLQEANTKIIQTGKGDGLILILDEVGKFLEFAATNPERQDVFFLQQLAEMASRSRKQPLMLICLLHQGFNAYAEQLTQTAQREWEKVAGRFDEILFSQPLDQIASLVASAINPDSARIHSSLISQAESTMAQAIELGWYGTSASRDSLRRLPPKLYPLDPMALPVLVRIFHRYGQNERSLFSFLCSHEPFGLRSFAQQPLTEKTRPYQLADLYDYVRTNFGHRLGVVSYRTHWNVIESTIEAHNTDNALELRVLKTIGILNLLNVDDLRPTKESIAWAVGGKSSKDRRDVLAILAKLAETPVLHFRGETRGYSLWPYTSVDIDARMEEAKRAIPQVAKISEAITEQLYAQPIVARAHYIQTGNLRYFDVVYCKPEELADKANSHQTSADGFIIIPLCETEIETRESKATAKSLAPRQDLICVIAVPRPLSHLNQAVLDALRWEWVQAQTPDLNNDRFAREEVDMHLREALGRLQSQVNSFIGLNRISGGSSLTWYYCGNDGPTENSFDSGRSVLHMLSALCDQTFHKAPKIKNELVNRNKLSSAAAAARMRLLELMFVHAGSPSLGLPADRKPPEKSMYLSVLMKTGLHREIDGTWGLGVPDSKHDSGNVRPVLRKIKDLLAKHPDTRLSISSLMNDLRRPPFGLRDGLFPLFLAIISIQDEQEIAFYENGTFLREVGKDAFLRMTKSPEKFEIQFCKIEGVRSELFQRLAHVLELPKSDNKNVALLDVVRNLCQFVAQLPEYVRNTKRLSADALAVRAVILDAREPVRMVFHDLPQACGFRRFEIGKPSSAKDAQQFVFKLRDALDQLRAAFFSLQQRMGESLAREFGYSDQPISSVRRKIANRSETLLIRVTESKLRTFAFRLFDEGLSESDWLESVGSVLALRPPNKWKDEDEDTFVRELENLGGRFKRVESAAFGRESTKRTAIGIRIAVTQADGTERQEVIHFDSDQEKALNDLQERISSLMASNQKLGVAAASRAIWAKLKPTEECE